MGAAVNYAISTGQNVVYIAATNARLLPFSVAVTGVDAATAGGARGFHRELVRVPCGVR